MTDHRFIEESFPVKEVGETSAREKSIRYGHISTLHIWWARRPLAASRATTYAALTAAPTSIEEWQRRRDFIVNLSQWDSSLNMHLLERARQEIRQFNDGRPPRILDPFAGGGSYPLEALRLGCETYACDYNPVAVLILKATLEFPQRFGRLTPTMIDNADTVDNLFGAILPEKRMANPLLEAVERWGGWVLQEAWKDLAQFYPSDSDGSVPVGYIWARTIPCQNPTCGSDIPLMRQFWLAKIEKKLIALYPETKSHTLIFRIVGDGYEAWPDSFDPSIGTISNSVATCPICGAMVDGKTTRRLFQEDRAGQNLIAVVLTHPSRRGKTYRLATTEDMLAFQRAIAALENERERLMLEWGIDPVPDEPIPLMSGTFNVPIYGMKRWGDLFNTRQKLALVTFANRVRQVNELMIQEDSNSELSCAVATYLAIAVDRLADYNSSITTWVPAGETIGHTFTRQALPMVWDYIEVNPASRATGDWNSALDWVLRVVDHCTQMSVSGVDTPTVIQASATQLPYQDDFFDAILTDPPYYNSVPYADLSDFFYVWLKRTLGNLYPDLFVTPLSPKDKEITEMASWDKERYAYKDQAFFEENLKRAFQEIWRVLKPKGITVIVYAHKSLAGWETVINALLDSGLVITGAWPLNTERQTRLRASESAALASSIYIVARKMARQATGFYNEVREELRSHLDAKLHRLWEEGIGGADFFIAAIGSAIEVFGKYEQVLDYEGNIVRADRLLDEVRTIATDYAVRQILHNGFAGEISDLTRFYVLWRWNYGEARVPFDEARKLSQSCGLDLTREWGRGGFIRKDKEFVQVLGPQLRNPENLKDAHELIDVLHCVLLLWEKSRRTELLQTLAASGYGQSEAFYRVAQAISETLPNESKEKKLLDGFLAGRERVREDVVRIAQQRGLWEE